MADPQLDISHDDDEDQSFNSAQETAERLRLVSHPHPHNECCSMPKRVFVGITVHTGLLVAYLMRVNISVAIALMGHDEANSGLVLGAFFVGYLWTQVPGGWAAARFGGASVLGVGIFCCSLLSLATVFTAGNVWFLIAVRALQGLCQGMIFPAATTLVSKWAPIREQGRMMGTVMLGGLVGTILGLAMSGYICALPEVNGWKGWQMLFALHGVMGLVWSAICFAFLYSSPGAHPSISLEEYDLIMAGQQSQDKLPSMPWGPIVVSGPVWAAIMAHLSYNWVFYCFLTCLPKYMRDILKFDITASGLTSCVPYLAMSLISFSAGYLADYLINAGASKLLVRRLFISGGLAGVSSLLVGISYIHDPMLSLLVLILGFAVLGLPASAIQIMFLDLSPNFAGLIHGMSNTLATVTGIFAPAVTYRIAADGLPEQWQQVFFISFAIVNAGALVFACASRHTIQPWNVVAARAGLSDAAVSFNSCVLRNKSATLIY